MTRGNIHPKEGLHDIHVLGGRGREADRQLHYRYVLYSNKVRGYFLALICTELRIYRTDFSLHYEAFQDGRHGNFFTSQEPRAAGFSFPRCVSLVVVGLIDRMNGPGPVPV